MTPLEESLFSLITETATNLPEDVRRAIAAATKHEREGSRSSQALHIINRNIDMARDNVLPICQDTGMPTFHVHTPVGVNQIEIRKALYTAIEEATRQDTRYLVVRGATYAAFAAFVLLVIWAVIAL